MLVHNYLMVLEFAESEVDAGVAPSEPRKLPVPVTNCQLSPEWEPVDSCLCLFILLPTPVSLGLLIGNGDVLNFDTCKPMSSIIQEYLLKKTTSCDTSNVPTNLLIGCVIRHCDVRWWNVLGPVTYRGAVGV